MKNRLRLGEMWVANCTENFAVLPPPQMELAFVIGWPIGLNYVALFRYFVYTLYKCTSWLSRILCSLGVLTSKKAQSLCTCTCNLVTTAICRYCMHVCVCVCGLYHLLMANTEEEVHVHVSSCVWVCQLNKFATVNVWALFDVPWVTHTVPKIVHTCQNYEISALVPYSVLHVHVS